MHMSVKASCTTMTYPGSVTRWSLFIPGLLVVTCTMVCNAQLSETFYDLTCPQVKTLVKAKVDEFMIADRGIAGGFLRLQFHDCFVRQCPSVEMPGLEDNFKINQFSGLWVDNLQSSPLFVLELHSLEQGCDASVLLDSVNQTAEKDSRPNLGSIRGLTQIDEVKAVVESACPGVVSCADIVILVARDATVAIGGPTWPVPLGRRDGLVSSKDEAAANLPSPNDNFGQLVRNFAAVGLNVKDLVILSGGHTIGRTQCAPILQRLYSFTGVNNTIDPSIDPAFVQSLMIQCPRDKPNNIVSMDSTNQTFDSFFFNDVMANRGLFTSDATLLSNPFSLKIVNESAQAPTVFRDNFAASMVKMGNISVLTGPAGEVRLNCRSINNT